MVKRQSIPNCKFSALVVLLLTGLLASCAGNQVSQPSEEDGYRTVAESAAGPFDTKAGGDFGLDCDWYGKGLVNGNNQQEATFNACESPGDTMRLLGKNETVVFDGSLGDLKRVCANDPALCKEVVERELVFMNNYYGYKSPNEFPICSNMPARSRRVLTANGGKYLEFAVSTAGVLILFGSTEYVLNLLDSDGNVPLYIAEAGAVGITAGVLYRMLGTMANDPINVIADGASAYAGALWAMVKTRIFIAITWGAAIERGDVVTSCPNDARLEEIIIDNWYGGAALTQNPAY